MIQIQGVGATNAVIAGSADFSQAGGSTLTRAAARGQRLLAIANTAERNIVAISLRKEVASARSTPTRTLIYWWSPPAPASGRMSCASPRSKATP